MKYRVCKEDYAWNPSICACQCNKDCGFDEYVKNCACIKNAFDNIVMMCNNIVNETNIVSASINK